MQPGVTPTLPFGLVAFHQPDDEMVSHASRTGMIVYPRNMHSKNHGKPQVVSFVNGCMCINPLGEFVCSVNFDNYIGDIAESPSYRLPSPNEPYLAYFDPATISYTTTPQSIGPCTCTCEPCGICGPHMLDHLGNCPGH